MPGFRVFFLTNVVVEQTFTPLRLSPRFGREYAEVHLYPWRPTIYISRGNKSDELRLKILLSNVGIELGLILSPLNMCPSSARQSGTSMYVAMMD